MREKMKQAVIVLLACCLLLGIKSQVTATEVTTTANNAEQTTAAVVPPGFTGVYQLSYYKNGQPAAADGWVEYNGEFYYFYQNRALTGWNYVKDLSGGKKVYKYYFDGDGILSQNLFKTFGARIRKEKLKIFVNLTTHNVTVYLYDSKKKDYIIPAKSWVCSTARDGKSTRKGNYYLAKGTATKWFIYKKSKPYHYYQYKVKIRGTNMLFHSEMYSGTRKNKLVARTYNGLGTNQTTRCIRSQCGNAYLLYRIAKENRHSIPVRIYRDKNKGPFGKKTLANSGGRVKSGTKYDPTDPALTNYKKVY